MSRYLKEVSATTYRFKRFFQEAGTYSVWVPLGTSRVKTLVFGGGGNSCTTTICNCKTQLQQCCCCCYARGHFSGAGGGFTEKLWYGVGGQTACIVVGGAEGTSSVCFCNFGTISATGGTGSGTSTRTTTPGSGVGGDVNRCGSNGYARCTYGFCRFDCCAMMACAGGSAANYCNSMCSRFYCELKGIHLPGGTPGNTLCNRLVDPNDNANFLHNCCCGCNPFQTSNNEGDNPSTNYFYGCGNCVTDENQWMVSCSFCTVPAVCWGFPSWYCQNTFPAGSASCIDPYYNFDWDPLGNCCCTCSRTTCNPGCFCNGSAGSFGCGQFGNFCLCRSLCFVNRSNESCTHTALGASGYGCAAGALGGGGAGIWNGDRTSCMTDYSKSGGGGLVVVFY